MSHRSAFSIALTLACASVAGSVQAQEAFAATSGRPALKQLDDTELSGVWGQALIALTNTSINGYDFSRLTLNADITLSASLSGLKLGTQMNNASDIDFTTLNFGRSDLDDAHRTVSITDPYFEWVYSGGASTADRQVVGMRIGFGGISGDVGLAMNTLSGALTVTSPAGQVSSVGSQSTALTGCGGACNVALNQLGGVTAGNSSGASNDFFLSVLKSALTYPSATGVAPSAQAQAGF